MDSTQLFKTAWCVFILHGLDHLIGEVIVMLNSIASTYLYVGNVLNEQICHNLVYPKLV